MTESFFKQKLCFKLFQVSNSKCYFFTWIYFKTLSRWHKKQISTNIEQEIDFNSFGNFKSQVSTNIEQEIDFNSFGNLKSQVSTNMEQESDFNAFGDHAIKFKEEKMEPKVYKMGQKIKVFILLLFVDLPHICDLPFHRYL